MRLSLRSGYGLAAAARNLLLVSVLLIPVSVHAQDATIAALGDSLTQGYGLPPEDGFVPVLEEWLREQGHDAEVINAGVSGDTTAGGLSRMDWTLSDEVEALIVTLGGNDLLRGVAPETSRANLAAIIEKGRARDLPILLIGMQASGNFGVEYKADFDAIYGDLAEKYGTLYAESFLNPLITAAGDEATARRLYMQADGIHPNAEGVKVIVAALGPKVVELIAETR